jgi:hypothetical protein
MCFLWGANWTVSTATSSQYLAVNYDNSIGLHGLLQV